MDSNVVTSRCVLAMALLLCTTLVNAHRELAGQNPSTQKPNVEQAVAVSATHKPKVEQAVVAPVTHKPKVEQGVAAPTTHKPKVEQAVAAPASSTPPATATDAATPAYTSTYATVMAGNTYSKLGRFFNDPNQDPSSASESAAAKPEKASPSKRP